MLMSARKRVRTYGKPSTATWPAAWRGTAVDVVGEPQQQPEQQQQPQQPAAKPLPPPDATAAVAGEQSAATPAAAVYGPPAPVCWCCGGGVVTREHPAVVCGFNQRPAYTETVVDLLPTCLPGLLICTECEGQMQRQTDAQAEQMMRRGYNDRFPRVKVINRWKPPAQPEQPAEPAPVYRRRGRRRCR